MISLENLEKNLELFLNSNLVDFHGVLVIIHDEPPFLVSEKSDYDDKFKVFLDFSNLENVLINNVGCLIGGPVLYFDKIMLDGFLEKDNNDPSKIFLKKITKMILNRDGEYIDILKFL